ncbi:hypothetical protein QWY31_14645 [Cytophagales bacterium LB-30]|uniref:Right-handed parallel beta-helix repeat-containing protein n=1 Tax=Shiella aurantiaca TaxID=3058365 RepID=A0ABT8F8D8_9BACT|nr:hypothetical protein [Shiella aurantiaca]MDN4166747.1 hypothetical protein [Shiella aurantiaca]
MSRNLRLGFLASIMALSSLVASCKKSDESEFRNTLKADAGENVIMRLEDVTTLDGSGSEDTAGKEFSFEWEVASKPSGSEATLEDETSDSPSFSANMAGEYAIALSVYNENFTVRDTVQIRVVENSLVADAGEDAEAEVNTSVALDGSASEDMDGGDFTVLWELVSGPTANSTITDPTALEASFTADEPGVYVLSITISNQLYEAIDEVSITLVNPGPVVLESIDANRTLANLVNGDAPDYVVTTDLHVDAELTIDPGVVISFQNNSSILINSGSGAIIAEGTAADPIRFIGNYENGARWEGMIVYSNDNRNKLSYVQIENTGATIILDGVKAGLALFSGAVLGIEHSSSTGSAGYGMYMRDGAELSSFVENAFTDNALQGMYMPANYVFMLDEATAYSDNNALAGIRILASSIDLAQGQEQTWVAPADGSAYIVNESLSIDAGWILNPGVKILMGNDARIDINVDGFIQARGTAEQHVVFANATGAFWKGIIIYSNNQTNSFTYTDFHRGANSAILSGVSASVALFSTAVAKFENCDFINETGYSLYVQDGALLSAFAKNTFTSMQQSAMRVAPNVVKQILADNSFNYAGGTAMVEVMGGSITEGIEATWRGFEDGTGYRLTASMDVDIPWHIMGGAKFFMNNDVHIIINSGDAYINTQGTQDKQVMFTGYTQQIGAWRGITIYSNNVMNSLNYTNFFYAGSNNLLDGKKASVALWDNTKATIQNCSFNHNPGYGVYVGWGAEVNDDIETVNTFVGNGVGTVYYNL